MDIITVVCPKCKGKLHIDEQTEKCFCMYCRTEIKVSDLGEESGVTLDSLVKRGFLSLEYADWQKALESFDQAADINPEHAMIYVGKLLAQLRLKTEKQLAKQRAPLTNHANYQKALRFAKPDLKERLMDYNETVEKRLAEEERRQKEQQEAKRRADAERLREEERRIRLATEERLRQWELDAPLRRKRKIRLTIMGILIIIGGIMGYFAFERLQEQRAEAERIAQQEEAEVAALDEVRDHIDAGYESWTSLLNWAEEEGIQVEIRVNDQLPTDETMANIARYGLLSHYLYATADFIETETGRDVLLQLHFSEFTYFSTIYELNQLDHHSEDALNNWLDAGGLARLNAEISRVEIEDVDEEGNAITQADFGKVFQSWSMTTLPSLADIANSRILITRIYRVFEATPERFTQAWEESGLASIILAQNENEFPAGFDGEEVDLGAFANWLGITVSQLQPHLFIYDAARFDQADELIGRRDYVLNEAGERIRQTDLTTNDFSHWQLIYENVTVGPHGNRVPGFRVRFRLYYNVNSVPAPGISQGNFELVTNGMTLADVQELFNRSGRLNATEGNIEIYRWHQEFTNAQNRTIYITFENGYVISKEQIRTD